MGRLCLQNWGFRRCEDICWIRTNSRNKDRSIQDPRAVFCRSAVLCSTVIFLKCSEALCSINIVL